MPPCSAEEGRSAARSAHQWKGWSGHAVRCGPEEPGPCSGAEDTQAGSAVVEYIFLAVLLMIPVVYLIITVAQLQAGAYAVVGAADQAAKVYVQASDEGAGRAAAEDAVMLALADRGFGTDGARLTITCSAGGCRSPGATVTATVTLRVPLPLVPTMPGVSLNAATVHAAATQLVGRFR